MTATPALDRITDPTNFDDQTLVVQYMLEDREMGEGDAGPDPERHAALDEEINRRFGKGATDRTADKATAWRMTSDDIVEWPLHHWSDCRQWLLGQITLDNWQEHYPR